MAHQTYAEFLAAHYLRHCGMAAPQMLHLILYPDGSGKVVSQLQEVAAWLALMEPPVFRALVRSDPETLLRSDVTSLTDGDRAELARNLLSTIEAEDVLDDHAIFAFYGRLKNPDLEGILRPYITDATRGAEVRRVAIGIAQECGVQGLAPELARVAVTAEEPNLVRVRAAAAVKGLDVPESNAALRPLALRSGDDDPDDELKGYGLSATWPGHLSAAELFGVLKPQKNRNLFGMYRRFLDTADVSGLRRSDFLIALCWAKEHLGQDRRIDPLCALAWRILAVATGQIQDPDVAEAMAEAMVRGWDYVPEDGPVASALRASAEVRQTLTRVTLPKVVSNPFGASILLDTCALSGVDALWLLGELETATIPGVQELLSGVFLRVFHSLSVEDYDLTLTAARGIPALADALAPFRNPVLLDSPMAAAMRSDYVRAQQYRHVGTDADTPTNLDPQRIRAILDSQPSEGFWRVCRILDEYAQSRSSDAPSVLAAWSELESDLGYRVIEAAEAYAVGFAPLRDTPWWKDGRFSYAEIAGFWALMLLSSCRQAPARFALLTDKVWDKWTAIVASFPFPKENDLYAWVLQEAHRRHPEQVVQVLGDVIDGENERYGDIYCLPALSSVE